MYAGFDRFEIKLTRKQALQGSHQGECDSDIDDLMKVKSIRNQLEKIGNEKISAELKEYGAWDEEERKDIEANYRRILWLACGNIEEEL